MIEKHIDIDIYDQNGEPNVKLITPGSYEFSKSASTYDYPKDLSDFIDVIKPDPLYLYLLINAVGAFEFWSSNKNGDAFPEKYLLERQAIAETRDGIPPVLRYKTFEKYARLYKLHMKESPKENAIGDILFSSYDNKMHRILLVTEFEKSKDPESAYKIENGYAIGTSMGCKVPFDICSVCGHKSASRKDYCVHLKTEMNQILPDGRLVCAFNTKPRFDDISIVRLPAWKPSHVLIKLASKLNQPPEKIFSIPILIKHALDKESDIEKEVPGQVLGNIEKLKYNESQIKEKDLEQITNYPLHQILASFFMMGMQPKPQELQKILLTKTGNEKLANELESQGLFFNENYSCNLALPYINKLAFGPNDVRYEICRTLYDYIPKRSVFGTHLDNRLSKVSQYLPIPKIEHHSTGVQSIIPLAAFFAGAMMLMRRRGLNVSKTFPEFLIANKWFIPALIGGGALLTNIIATEPPTKRYWPNVGHEKAASEFSKLSAQFSLMKSLKPLGHGIRKGTKVVSNIGKFSLKHPSALVGAGGIPSAYLGAGYLQAREQTGKSVPELLKFIQVHPFMTGGAVSGLGGLRFLQSLKNIK